MEIEWPVFPDAMIADAGFNWNIRVRGSLQLHVREVTIDLVRAREDEGYPVSPPAQRIEEAEGPAEVDVEILARVDHACRHGHLGGKVEHG